MPAAPLSPDLFPFETSPGILCIGDVMLDRFITGQIHRISPEAPVPIFNKTDETAMLGGAGNVARNLSGLGATCFLVSVVGADLPAQDITTLCAAEKGCRLLAISCPERLTTVKTRFVSDQQQILRMDEENPAPIGADTAHDLLQTIQAILPQVSVVILSDYAKGVLNPQTLPLILTACRARGVRVLVDPRAENVPFYKGASIITPNQKEFGEMCQVLGIDAPTEVARAAAVIEKLDLSALLVTKGADGMMLFEKGKPSYHIATKAQRIFDVSGAGDTVIATLACALGSGASLSAATAWANRAAGIVVARPGTAPIFKEDLRSLKTGAESVLEKICTKVCSWSQLQEDLKVWRQEGVKVGFTNGCFDLIHPGHVTLLAQAKQQCDILIIGLNTDASIARLKGPERPLQDQASRSLVMAGQESVDRVILFDEETPEDLIHKIGPTVLFKGADYALSDVVGGAFVTKNGGQVILIDLVPDKSTTRLVNRSRAI